MKSRLLIVIALLFFVGTLYAQSDRTFASMGYDDASIVGINGSVSYFIKVKPDDNVDQSKIVINVRASQVLNPNNSFVIVYLKDAPIFTQRISASPVDSVFSMVIPLSRKYLQPDGRFIKLKIGAKLSISDEYCKDIDNPACWINVRNTSYVSQVSQPLNSYQRSLKEWIQEFTSVYTPKAADANDLTAGGIIYTLLKQSASSVNKEIFTAQYSPNDSTLPSGIIVGAKDKLPVSIQQALPQTLSAGQGLITLVGVNVGLYTKYVLVVTGGNDEGYKKAIYTLASNRRLSSAFTDKLLVSEAVPSNYAIESPSPLVTSLDDIGGTPALMEGIGSLRSKYNFSLTEFNAIPTKLLFHLESYFSTLKADDRGFVNIYLNQNLIYNASLLDKSSFINDIDLKPYLLTKFNTLEVEFRFHPGANICKDGFSNFFAFVNTKSSTLTFSGERENRFYSFFNFPAEFRKTETKIIVSPSLMSKDIVSSIGEIYYQLNSPIKNDFNKLIVPPIQASDKTNFSDLNSLNLIVLLDKADGFIKNFSNMPVRYDKDFQIYSDADKKTTYSINDFSNSGIAQIFREKGSTILLVTALGDSMPKNSFVSVIKNFSTQLTEIESNVCIANSNGLSNYFFKMPEDNNMVSYKSDKSWLTAFWDNFKFVILGILLILVVLAYFFVRSKVKQSQEIV